MKTLAQNRDNLAKLADPRGLSEAQIKQVIATTKPNYHVIGGLHSTETGPSEMLMELVYRVAVETSPMIAQIRNNVYLSVTPVADVDGRDRQVDWFYRGLEAAEQPATPPSASAGQPATTTGNTPEAGRGAQAGGRAGQAAGQSAVPAEQGGRGGEAGAWWRARGRDWRRDWRCAILGQVRPPR